MRDYDEALAFYVGKLGFSLIEDTYQPAQDKRWVVVSPPGATESALLLARASTEHQATRVGEDRDAVLGLLRRDEGNGTGADAPYDELQRALPQQAVLNGDETGHRTNGAKRWHWTLVAPTFIFYAITTSRGSDVLRSLLGATFAGILGSDRLPTYLTYAAGCRQFCWSHFRRNLLSAQELATSASAKRFCREALASQQQLFRLWHRFRGSPDARRAPLTRAQLIAKAFPIEKKFFALGERYVNAADTDVGNLARALFVHHQHFFTFVHEEGVEPTNNAAERARRTAVQWRKIMFGNRSADGERAVARLLTVTRTCQLQQLNALAYLTAAIRCHRRRQAVASLLPKRLTP